MAVPGSFPAVMAPLAAGQPDIIVSDINGYNAAVKLGSSYSLTTPTVIASGAGNSTTKIVVQAINLEQADGRPSNGHGSR